MHTKKIKPLKNVKMIKRIINYERAHEYYCVMSGRSLSIVIVVHETTIQTDRDGPRYYTPMSYPAFIPQLVWLLNQRSNMFMFLLNHGAILIYAKLFVAALDTIFGGISLI